ncbi:orotate phosphoribosyltransferase [Candidatus Aenigmatarchaeota archaeon]
MQAYKSDFIRFLLSNEALRIGKFTLKSGRESPYFVNTGMFNDGISLVELGRYYARCLNENGPVQKDDVIYGPPDKGTALALATSMGLANINCPRTKWAYRRTKPKDYGDAAGDRAKGLLVGHSITDGDRVILVDDVFTTGDTKYEAVDFVKGFGEGITIPGLVIAVNRQETDREGGDAIADFQTKTEIPVSAIVTATEIFDSMTASGDLHGTDAERFDAYLRQYGVEGVRNR